MTVESAGLEQAGEVKFGQVGIANLRVRELDIERLTLEMRERLARAPKLFERAALVVDFGSLTRCPDAPAARRLIDGLHQAGVRPVALAFGTGEIEQLALALDLPVLARFRAHYQVAQPAAPEHDAPLRPADPPTAPTPVVGTIHRQPVRSGQQLYAQARDLTVLAGVGAGAEVIADGSIHVYGALRGRALAGAQGDAQSRIFCREFHAELVAIAGHYQVLEDLPKTLRGKAVQVWLENGKLRIEELT